MIDCMAEKKLRCPVLILGIGNILLRDEGIGPRLIEALEKEALPPGVELCDGGTAGGDLIDVLAERQKVIIIDSIDADGPPGTIFKLSQDDLAKPSPGISLHELGISETLEMTRQLSCAPRNVVIFGIKPASTEYGTELSAQVLAITPRLITLVLTEARL